MTAPVPPVAYRPVTWRCEPPLAFVEMQDSAGGNGLSPELVDGLIAALARAAETPEVRAVVLGGGSDFFCAGASADRMLGPREGRVTRVWELLCAVLDCPLPVISSAQGHAFGGGLLLALVCDAAVLSRRSRYAVNFLLYGFTPIGGATHLIPAVMGPKLGAEMLYTGRTYRGQELAERGAGVRIVEHDAVPREARRAAAQMSAAPRVALELLKAQLSAPLRAGMAAALQAESPAHEATVTGAEAEWRIRQIQRVPRRS
ncbi:polyketide synthase [Micromonospora profundi]|uniref:polyketide synthase n=1 Tax=Micromonospora profundi TaxID=1420889 RepID=UPI0033A2511C